MNHISRRKHPRNKLLEIRCWATLAVLFSIGLGVLLPTRASTEEDVLHILILGDSITQADINRASFRYPLWKKLIDTEIQFDFVGSMQSHRDRHSKGIPPQPDYKGIPFDKDHEGHFAWTASDIIIGRNPNNGTGSGNLHQWLQGYDFDIALVHLGTNDVFRKKGNAHISGALKAVIRTLRSDNPDAIILLAQVLPTKYGDTTALALVSMNEMISELVEGMNTSESPVILVDQHTGFDTAIDSYDGVHPNAQGEEKMAQRWFEAIQSAIQANRPDLPAGPGKR